MMKELDKQIKKAIEADLPKQVGEALQIRLARANELEQLYSAQLKKNETLQSTLDISKRDLQVLQDLHLKSDLVTSDRRRLDTDILKFSVEKRIGEHKVTSANEKVDLLNNLMGLMMKNPKAVTSMSTSHSSIPHYRPDGQQDFEPTNSVTTITKTNEKPG